MQIFIWVIITLVILAVIVAYFVFRSPEEQYVVLQGKHTDFAFILPLGLDSRPTEDERVLVSSDLYRRVYCGNLEKSVNFMNALNIKQHEKHLQA